MLTPSLPTEAPTGLPAAARRRIQAGMIARSAAGVPRVGVLPFSTDPIVTGTAELAMTYQIGSFVAVTARNGAGVEWVANDAIETVSTTPAPGSNSRIDVIWVRSQFPLAGDVATTTTFGVKQGVANASPSKPSIPAGALELASAVVTSSDLTTQTVVITPTHPFTAMSGGVVWLRNQADQDAWTPADGALAYRVETGGLIHRTGGVWVPVAKTLPHFVYRKTGGFQWSSTTADHTWDAAPFEGPLAGFTTSDRVTFTCTVPGVYSIDGQLTSDVGNDSTDILFVKNGVTHATFNGRSNPDRYMSQRFSVKTRFAVGDTFKLRLAASGTTLGVPGAQSFMSVDMLHA